MTLQDSNAGVQGHLQAILDAIADGVVVIDHDGVICFANPAAAELFQRPKSDLLGHPFGFPTKIGESIEIELDQADVETELLSRLMAQFMEVSQLEQGRREINRAPLDLTQIVKRIVDREQARSPRYELRTHLPGEPVIAMVDPNAIEQIVANTLSYAMRNAAEQPLDITLTRDGSVARLAVRHHGRAMVED